MGVRARDGEDDELDVTVPSKRRATFDMSKLLEALTAATSSHGNNADALKSIRELLSLRRVICHRAQAQMFSQPLCWLLTQGVCAESELFGESLFAAVDRGCSDQELGEVHTSAALQ